MPIKWDYAQLTHDAALHGGPEGYNAFIRRSGFCEGVVTCIAIKAIHYLFDRYVYGPLCEARLKADQVLVEETKAPVREDVELKRIINNEGDIEHDKSISEDNDIDEMDADMTLEELKVRLDALKSDVTDYHHYLEYKKLELEDREENLEEFRFEDELFSFLADIDLEDEDDVFVRLAQSHPAYKSFKRNYQMHKPEANELQVVKAFAISMAPYTEEEAHDEV